MQRLAPSNHTQLTREICLPAETRAILQRISPSVCQCWLQISDLPGKTWTSHRRVLTRQPGAAGWWRERCIQLAQLVLGRLPNDSAWTTCWLWCLRSILVNCERRNSVDTEYVSMRTGCTCPCHHRDRVKTKLPCSGVGIICKSAWTYSTQVTGPVENPWREYWHSQSAYNCTLYRNY